MHVQGCLILSQVGLLFPVNHAPMKMASLTGFAPVISCMRGRHVDWTTPQGQKDGEGKRICTFDLMHVTHPLWLAELCPRKWWERRVLPSLPLACQTSALLMSYVPENGAGERSRTVVSALARPHSAVEPHPRNGVPSRTLTGNLTLRTRPLCVLSYGDEMVRTSGNAPDPGTDLVRCGV